MLFREEMGSDLFLDRSILLNFKKGLDRATLVKVRQDYPQGCTRNVCDHVRELGASCWQISLDQFNRKTYTTGHQNRDEKNSINRGWFPQSEIGREEESEGDKT
jgi:hypothetical protein